MKKIGIILFMLFSFAVSLSAQESNAKKATVFVKGGSVLSGMVDVFTNGNVRVETESGEIFEFAEDEIRKIKYPKAPFNFDRKGYMGIFEQSIGGGFCDYPDDYYYDNRGVCLDYKITLINGYQTAKGLFIGLGASFDLHIGGSSPFLMPLFLHIRKVSPTKKVSPYFGASAGYVIDFYGASNAMAELSFGMQAKFRRRGAFWLGVSATYCDDFKQYISESHYDIYGALKIGFSF